MEEDCGLELPTYVALKRTQGEAPFKYLGVEDDGKLAYSFDKVLNDRAKFAVEYVGPALCHIRSCYNNKYWVRFSESENWIAAKADEPIENKSAWNCTLFKTNLSDDEKSVTFDHVQLEKNVGCQDNKLCLNPQAIDSATANLATTSTTTGNFSAVSTVVNYKSLVTLPRYVAFKHPKEGSLLSTYTSYKNYCFNTFTKNYEDRDMGSLSNIYEVFTNNDGLVYLKSQKGDPMAKDKYWAVWSDPPYDDGVGIPNFVGYKDGDPNNNTDFLFSVVKAGDDKFSRSATDHNTENSSSIALRHLRTNKFLQIVSGGRYISHYFLLTATSDTMTENTKLIVVEPVIKREIKVIKFHVERARIYDRKPLNLVEGGATNMISGSEQEFTLQLAYTKTWTSTWNTTKSWNINTSIALESEFPEILGFKNKVTITIGGGYSEEYQWGKSVEKSQNVSTSYVVKVPPMKKVIVTAIATEAKCDVPYSYKQTDYMADGSIKTTTKTDGLYTGVNSFHFDYIVNLEEVNSTA